MEGRLVLGLLLLGACRAELGDVPGDSGSSPTDTQKPPKLDGGIDGPQILGPWGAPDTVAGADTALGEDDATLSSDRLELYFKRNDNGDVNIYVMTRDTPTEAFGPPAPVTAVNTTVGDEESPRLTPDDKTMYFGRDGDIFRSTRNAVDQPWGMPAPVTTLNTAAFEKWAAVCSNGYVMVSRAVTGNSQDLFEGNISTGANTAIAQFNTTSAEQGTFLTTDCLHVYFQSSRDGNFNIYTAERATTTSAWSNPTKIPDFNTVTFDEEDAWVAPDQRTFVFTSNSGGNKDIYISTR